MTTASIRFVGHATTSSSWAASDRDRSPAADSLGPLERHRAPPEERWFETSMRSSVTRPPRPLRPLVACPDRRPRGGLVPRGLGRAAARAVDGEVVEVVAGERFAIGRVEVEVVPARHWMTPGTPRALPIGYLLHAPGSPSVYFAGDTGWFPGLDRLAGRVDVALLPVWTWRAPRPGTSGPTLGGGCAGRLGAAGAVPIHWGTLYPRRLSRVWDRPLRQPGWRFAGHAALLAPAADVRVLRPGAIAAFSMTSGSPRRPPSRSAVGWTDDRADRTPRPLRRVDRRRGRRARGRHPVSARRSRGGVHQPRLGDGRAHLPRGRRHRRPPRAARPERLLGDDGRTEEAMEITRSLRPAALEDEASSEHTLP